MLSITFALLFTSVACAAADNAETIITTPSVRPVTVRQQRSLYSISYTTILEPIVIPISIYESPEALGIFMSALSTFTVPYSTVSATALVPIPEISKAIPAHAEMTNLPLPSMMSPVVYHTSSVAANAESGSIQTAHPDITFPMATSVTAGGPASAMTMDTTAQILSSTSIAGTASAAATDAPPASSAPDLEVASRASFLVVASSLLILLAM